MLPLIPIISLVSTLVPEALRFFGKNNEAEVAERIGAAAKEITGEATVEGAADVLSKQPELALQFKLAVLAQEKELTQLAFERERAYIADVADARKYRDEKVFWLGVVVLLAFAVSVALVMYGGYNILRGGVEVEAGMFAAISGFIGTLIGYVAANAQSVVSYYYGSSQGSMQKSDAISDSIKAFGDKR